MSMEAPSRGDAYQDRRGGSLPGTAVGLKLAGLLLAVLCACLATAAGASAQALCTNTWSGPSEGNWQTAADWSAGHAPTSADVACIGAGDTVDVSEGANQSGVVQGEGALTLAGGLLELTNALEASSIASLSLSNATLTTAGSLDVSSSLVMSGSPATVNGSGTLVVGAGATGTINETRCSRLLLNGVTLLNQGTLTMGASGGAADGPIWMENGAQLKNTGTFNDDSTEPAGCGFGRLPSIYDNGSGLAPSITNTGTFQTASSEEPIEINTPLNNQGTVNAQTGTLQLAGNGTGTSGTWSTASGTTLAFTGGSYALNGDTWSGTGTISVAGANVTAASLKSTSAHVSLSSGALTIPEGSTSNLTTLGLSGGTLGLTGQLNVTSTLNGAGATTSTINGPGKLVVGPSATGTIGERCFRLLLNGVTLLNQGTLTFGSSGGAPDGAIWMENGAQLQNTGTFNDDSTEPAGCGYGPIPSIYNHGGSPTPSITNTGTYQTAGSEEPISITVPFNNQGTLNAQAGTLQFSGGGSASNSTWSAASGTTLAFTGGSYALNGDTWSGPGTISVAGANVTAASLKSTSAHVSLSSGALTIPEGSTSNLTTLGLSGGTLGLAGQLNVTSTLTGGGSDTTTINGPGKLVVESGATGTIGERCFRLLLNGVTLLNQGTLTFGSSGGAPDGAIWMENGAQLQNTGTFNDDSTEPAGCGYGPIPSIYNHGGTPTPSITNTGTYQANGGNEPIETTVPLNNQGTINVKTGNLQLAGDIANTKLVSLGAGTALRVGGNYTQSENGTLRTAIASTSSFGTLSVAGTATLAGLLNVVAANGFSAELGQTFAIVSTASRSGTFAFLSGTPGAGLSYQPHYSLTGVSLAVSGSEGQEPVPVIASPPTISGSSQQQGQTLVLTHGSWKFAPSEYSDQWLRCDGSGNNCSRIEGASGQTYVLSRSDVGHTIEVQEVAHNAAGDSAPSTSAPTAVVSALPVHAVAGESVKTVEDAEVAFDGSGSTPASEITAYSWEFGDGGGAQGAAVRHAYRTPGTYTATLTVSRGSEHQSQSLTVTVTPKPEPSKTASITVLDPSNDPVGEVDVLYVSPQGTRIEAATDSHGVAALPSLPEGASVIYAYKSGFRPATGLVNVNNEHVGSTSISLEPGEVATAGLSSHEMTLSEIVEAGINPSEPANQIVYEFEAKIGFPEEEKKPIELHGFVNGSGQLVGTPPGGSGLTCSPTGCETQGEQGNRVVVTPKIVENHPIIQWLIFSGKAAMVKQFFEVSMVVQNLSTEEPFSLTEGTATLNLPAGMSLAPTSQPQSLTQHVEGIPPLSSVTTNWVVRGDQPGQYNISADYNSVLEPFLTPVSLQTALAQPLDVWGTNALTPALRVDRPNPERGIPYHVSIGVTNKANIPLYNVAIAVNQTNHEHFIYQPKQQFSATIAEVPPGQTVFAPANILVPDSRREVESKLQEINLAGEGASTSGVVQDVTPPPLYTASAEAGSSPVHLRWQQVPHAEGYEVFSTPTLDTPFGSSPNVVRQTPGGEAITRLPASATEAYVSGGSFFAISSIVEGHLVLDHPVVETLQSGEPEVQEKEKELEYGTGNEAQPHKPHCLHGDPVNCVTGNHVESQADFSIGGRGPGLHMTRSYNSQMAAAATQPGPLGFGWTGPYSAHLVIDGPTGAVAVHQDNGSVTPFAIAEGQYWPASPLVQATLVQEASGEFLYTLPDQSKLIFNSTGELIRETDRNGNSVSLSYEAGRLTSVTDPGGRKMTLSYNSEGFLERATDPMGHTVKYAYEAGNLASVTEPGETAPRWRYKYDSAHELTSATNGLGHALTTEYDGEHRAISQTDALGHKRKWSYAATAEGSETTITEPNGSVTLEQFDAAGLPSSITHAAGTSLAATSTYEYDRFGDLVASTNPLGHKAIYAYDAEGNRTSETNALGQTTKSSYNSAHEVTSTTAPNGETSTTERDVHGNPIKSSHPVPGGPTAATKYKYDTHGQLESVTDPLGRSWHYEYDEAGDRVAEIDPEGDKRTFSYDADSNVIATVSARGNATGALPSKFTTKVERDGQEREIKTTNPLGRTTKATYDANGNIASATDANGHTTTYTYDANNELIKTAEPAGTATETGYESMGQESSQTDANKHTTKYVHNLLGEVTEINDPLGRTTKKEYDTGGELTKLTDAAGRSTSYRYNGVGHLTEVSYSDGKTSTVKYEYDADGNRTKMLDGSGLSTYVYDQLDRLSEVINGHGDHTAYEYDLANEQTKITYPNGKAVTRTYDLAGRLHSVTDWLGHTSTFSYDADSNDAATTFPTSTGEQDTSTYNEADQPTKALMKKGSKTVASLTYTRENNGQLKSTSAKSLPGEAKTAYVYDANNRLTTAGSTAYAYDPAGNPLKAGSNTSTYDEADELKTGTGVSYSYNVLGQRAETVPTSGAATSYGYDQAGDLVSVTRPQLGSAPAIADSYAYDGGGLRTSQTVAGVTSHLTWDSSASLPLLLSDGASFYLYGPGGLPLEQIPTTGGVLYFHHDQQGSTRMLTGETGSVQATFNYNAYGALVGSSGTASTSLGYDGQLSSPDTGLIYLRARSYDPSTGQFLTVDGGGEVTRSRYRYVGDNPLNGTDLSGLCGVNTESLGGFFGSLGEDANPVSTENCFYQGTKGLLETVGVSPGVIATGASIAGLGATVFLAGTGVGLPLAAALGALAASASAYSAGENAANGEYLAASLDGVGALLGGAASAEHLLEGLSTLAGKFPQLGDLSEKIAPTAKQLAEVFDQVAATSSVASNVLGHLHQIEREEAEGCSA
jgi:RHS repeat-associated protein